MAVANTFTFGGVSTSAYGLVVEGPGDYSAPKRAVDTIEIPGRNGAFQLDKGYYENIELEYKVVVKEATQDDFLDSIDAFRNAIVSQIGYQRLEDTYHPGEYRMAMYSGGLDEDPQFHGNGAVFKVTFDCKPQRFLTSGETAVAVTSGDTLTNPTLFEASPLLEVDVPSSFNTGSIDIENSKYPSSDPYEIWLTNGDTGEIVFVDAPTSNTFFRYNSGLFESGDQITAVLGSAGMRFRPNYAHTVEITSYSKDSGTLNTSVSGVDYQTSQYGTTYPVIWFDINQAVSLSATASAVIKDTYTVNVKRTPPGGSAVTTAYKVEVRAAVSYNSSGNSQFYASASVPSTSPKDTSIATISTGEVITYASGYSTVPALDGIVYIDTAIGMAYKYDVSGNIMNLNKFVEMRSDLPVLTTGENEIVHYVGTLNITPRWWKI